MGLSNSIPNSILQPGVCTSSTRPASPYEGQFIYETDNELVYVWTGSAWVVWSGGLGSYTTFTPTLVQSGAVTKTVTNGRYHRSGDHVTGHAVLTVTGTGTAANAIVVGFPVALAASINANSPIGDGFVYDASANLFYFGMLMPNGFFLIRSNANSANYLGVVSFTAALAAGDIVSYNFSYEAA